MPTSEQQIARTISAMRDSVWVVNSEIQKTPSIEVIESIQRNVIHLELEMSDENVTGSGEDLSDVTAAIAAGKAYVEQNN
jgi:hypothetical protein